MMTFYSVVLFIEGFLLCIALLTCLCTTRWGWRKVSPYDRYLSQVLGRKKFLVLRKDGELQIDEYDSEISHFVSSDPVFFMRLPSRTKYLRLLWRNAKKSGFAFNVEEEAQRENEKV